MGQKVTAVVTLQKMSIFKKAKSFANLNDAGDEVLRRLLFA